ncbi:MAG: chemotaxis-specific protein-glutamate methyltransferase CheB [Deltaproteobacteria bacterium]|nr:chemotaxis-specific protein-glutamate methyltransferase CheB [Deltaproteobacteria bacterium]
MTLLRKSKIRVLIVDDSASVRMMLERIFSADPAFEVAGSARDGEEAIAAVERLSPDVATMDIYMPGMNGHEATRRIMETHPIPIVIVSGNLDEEEVVSSFRAMEAGALAAVAKPRGAGHPEHEADCALLLSKVKLMAEVRVVKRWPRAGRRASPPLSRTAVGQAAEKPRVVAIGASTGGPVVINTILSALAPGFPLPVLIVQHMAPGFIRGFAEWLGLSTRLPVHVASQGERMLPGHVYIAPEEFQMLAGIGDTISLTRSDPENGQRPSVSTLFRSIADVYGSSAVGILLTGMGDDGARELKLMKDKGAVTIAQDRQSSVIFGMPGEAVKLGAASYVFPPAKIVAYLLSSRIG